MALFLLVGFAAQAQTAKEKTQIVEQALTIPEVQAHFNLREKPELQHLAILDNGKLLNTLPVKFAGNPVKFAKRGEVGQNYAEFTHAEFKPATAHLTYTLPLQKVSVDVNLVKKGERWVKKTAQVTPLK